MFSLKSICLIVSIVLVGITSQIPAQTVEQTITKRQIKQEKRIRQGVKTGELTRRETTVLRAEQIKIERDKLKAESNGVITKQEKRKIQTLSLIHI